MRINPVQLLLKSAVLLALCACTTPLPVTLENSPEPAAPSETAALPTATLTTPSPTFTATSLPTSTPIPVDDSEPPALNTPTPAPLPTYDPASWVDLPVIPSVSQRARLMYEIGQVLGNNPGAFSKVGDCETVTRQFLGTFDLGTDWYDLGPYTDLQPVIGQFQGSFSRTSLASQNGFTAAAVLNPLMADPKVCLANESPLFCEYRVHQPSFAIIMLGTNDVRYKLETFEKNLREIIELSVDQGVLPVLATKADNLEKDGSRNALIAQLANEYELPLWNFWRALQELPDQGLQEDGIHLTWGPDKFGNPEAMIKGWPVRNLTALQALDAVWRSVTAP
jgi:hypothetical protein